MDSKNTPTLIIIFNRTETTKRLIERLRQIKPTELYVVADGARANKLGEKELCEATRQIIETIDWPCNVYKKYSDENHGCDKTIEAGLTWFFENVEMGIILEDDCIPDPTFFDFATVMLEKYKEDERVFHINGSNFQNGQIRGNGSYYFSLYAHSWGWATWRRAWKFFDHKLSSLPQTKKDKVLEEMTLEQHVQRYWLSFFDKLYKDFNFAAWDPRWIYAIWSHKGVCITPNQNLIENIGWGKDATHTDKDENLNRPVKPMKDMRSPSSNNVDKDADEYTYWHYFYRSFWQKLSYKLRQLIKI